MRIPDVTLLDQDTGVVDGLGKTELVDASLKTTLQEVLNAEGQDVIELHAGLIEDTDADQTANQSVTFEKTLGVLLVEGEKLTVLTVSHCSINFSWPFSRSMIHAKWGAHTEQHDESWTG